MTTVQAAQMRGTAALKVAGIDSAARDTQLLLARALEVSVDRLILMAHDEMGAEATAIFDAAIKAREGRTPVSHILGGRMFFDRWFQVTFEVLDPRPETEILIIEAAKHPAARMLDLGTGSGAIICTLLAENPQATGVATDISQAAIEVAGRNASDLGVDTRLSLLQSDWFAAVTGSFDLIVSNPPYIAAAEMHDLQPEVRNHEPRIALTDETDGLTCYRAICAGAQPFLRPNGWLMVEIGPTQAAAVTGMMAAQGFADIATIKDLDGRDRVVKGRKPA